MGANASENDVERGMEAAQLVRRLARVSATRIAECGVLADRPARVPNVVAESTRLRGEEGANDNQPH